MPLFTPRRLTQSLKNSAVDVRGRRTSMPGRDGIRPPRPTPHRNGRSRVRRAMRPGSPAPGQVAERATERFRKRRRARRVFQVGCQLGEVAADAEQPDPRAFLARVRAGEAPRPDRRTPPGSLPGNALSMTARLQRYSSSNLRLNSSWRRCSSSHCCRVRQWREKGKSSS